MNKVTKFLFNKGSSAAYAIITAIFTVVPEDSINFCKINDKWPESTNILISRLIVCIGVFILSNIVYCIYRKKRKRVSVSNHNISIQIEYGDIFKVSDGKVLIDFDECFSTKVGDAPSDIKPDSVCGQYLIKHPIDDIQDLVNKANIKPARGKSKFNNLTKYIPGTIIPNDNFLLMAFSKLDENGRGCMSYDEYLQCLDTLWEQIDRYHGTKDVYMPILGSRIVRFDKELSQQELLNIIISSYVLSPRKLKTPFKLHIICRPCEGFSLNNIIGVN